MMKFYSGHITHDELDVWWKYDECCCVDEWLIYEFVNMLRCWWHGHDNRIKTVQQTECWLKDDVDKLMTCLWQSWQIGKVEYWHDSDDI